MHQARPYVAIVVAVASGTAGTMIGGMLAMRTAYGLDLFGLLLVGGFVGSFVGLIAGAGIYAAFVRLGRGR